MSSYAIGTNLHGMKATRGVSASCIVIALSACWLINHALACIPPPSILYNGVIITGGVVVRTLVDLRFAVVGPVSGRISKHRCYSLNCWYRPWCIISCDPPVGAWSCYQILLGHQVTRLDDCCGLRNSCYLALCPHFHAVFPNSNVIVHPLFVQGGWI